MIQHNNLFGQNTILCFLLLTAFYIFIGLSFEDPFKIQSFKNEEKNKFTMSLQLPETRATYLTVQTQLSPGWCRMQASALLSNISVVSLGLGERYSHALRPHWILQYITRNNLDDSHVLVFMDGGDTFFTSGLTMQQAVSNFINSTAATAKAFDANAVMNGKRTAPFLFGAEEGCWGADIWYIRQKRKTFCCAQYIRAYRNTGYAFLPVNRHLVDRGLFDKLYLNAGTFISRVWAFKKAFVMYHARLNTRKKFSCDQAVWASIFLECTLKMLNTSNDNCLPQGLISLDYQNNLSLHPYGFYFHTKNNRPWSRSAVDKYIAKRNPPFPHFFRLADNPSATPGIVHFPGWQLSFLSDIPKMLEKTAWVRESHRDRRSILQSTKYLRNNATVKAYYKNGEVKVFKYGDVCSADNVMNETWLGIKQPKR